MPSFERHEREARGQNCQISAEVQPQLQLKYLQKRCSMFDHGTLAKRDHFFSSPSVWETCSQWCTSLSDLN